MADPAPNLGLVGGRRRPQPSNASNTADFTHCVQATPKNACGSCCGSCCSKPGALPEYTGVKKPSSKAPLASRSRKRHCLPRGGLLHSNPWLAPPLSPSQCLLRWSVTVRAGTTNRHRAAESSSEPGRLALDGSDLFDSFLLLSDFGCICCRVLSRDVFSRSFSLRKPLCPNLFPPVLPFSSPAPPTASVMQRPAGLLMRARPCICTPRTRTAVNRR